MGYLFEVAIARLVMQAAQQASLKAKAGPCRALPGQLIGPSSLRILVLCCFFLDNQAFDHAVNCLWGRHTV